MKVTLQTVVLYCTNVHNLNPNIFCPSFSSHMALMSSPESPHSSPTPINSPYITQNTTLHRQSGVYTHFASFFQLEKTLVGAWVFLFLLQKKREKPMAIFWKFLYSLLFQEKYIYK